jgi:hypothetical protein
MTDIAGVFGSSAQANHAYEQLLKAGFHPGNISLIVSKEGYDRVFTGVTTTKQGAHDAAKGAALGALGVGALGTLVGGLMALVIGPGVLAAGPLYIALSSGVAGAAIGGLSGALVEAGFSHDEAGEYVQALEAGKVVLVLHDIDPKQVETARIILRSVGAQPRDAA